MSTIFPPKNYVPEFCSSNIERVSHLLFDLNEKFSEFRGLVSKNDIDIKIKIDELEKLYHEIDKEFFRVSGMTDLVSAQSNLNITFSGKFESIEKRIKILLSIVFLGVSSGLTFLYFFIKMWAGGV